LAVHPEQEDAARVAVLVEPVLVDRLAAPAQPDAALLRGLQLLAPVGRHLPLAFLGVPAGAVAQPVPALPHPFPPLSRHPAITSSAQTSLSARLSQLTDSSSSSPRSTRSSSSSSSASSARACSTSVSGWTVPTLGSALMSPPLRSRACKAPFARPRS